MFIVLCIYLFCVYCAVYLLRCIFIVYLLCCVFIVKGVRTPSHVWGGVVSERCLC